MSEKNSKKNFWIGVSLPIAIFIGYGIYMIYSYSTGSNNEFKKRYGMVLSEKQMMQANKPNGNVMNAFEAIAVIRDETDLLKTIEARKKSVKKTKEYSWKATALKDKGMKNWQVTIREYKIKPKLVCQGVVITSNQEVEKFRCFESKI